MKKLLLAHGLLLLAFLMQAQNKSYQCYPANWWAGMKWNNVQLMLYGTSIGSATGFSINYPGIQLKKVSKVENKNYVFLDISIAPTTKPGIAKIIPANCKVCPQSNSKSNPGEKVTVLHTRRESIARISST
jgi:hypothetical protein